MIGKAERYKTSLFKEEVARGLHELHTLGMLPTDRFGDVSVRDPETGYVYLSVRPGSFQVENPLEYHGCDTVVYTPDGQPVEAHNPPCAAMEMHLSLYRARSDLNAIVHTFTPWTNSFALRGEEIPYVLAEQGGLGGSVRCVARPPEMESPDYCAAVVEAMEARHACILRDNGAIAAGWNLDRAVNFLAWMESVARKLTRASLLGEPHILPSRTKPLGE